ncbi:MAG: DUF721 domain-containing protein [Acidimicrobiia bacterium]|nr:DUF721 domain-containing protein [Acidimicrobiia bacterium]
MSLDPVADMLAPYLERLGITKPDAAARVMNDWTNLAGEPWATSTRPGKLEHGELTLDVVDAGTLSVLRYRTGELLQALDDAVGEGLVEVIRLRVAKQPW